MNFSDALNQLKNGKAIWRSGWNGKGMFLYLVQADSYEPKTEIARNYFDDLVPYRSYIAMKTVDETVTPWIASHSDILEDDWEIND